MEQMGNSSPFEPEDASRWQPVEQPHSEPRQRSIRSTDAECRKSAHPVLYPGLTWLLGLMVGVVLLRWFVPQFAEEIQYAITRGEQRAKYEVAGESLNKTGLNDVSLAYQMVSQRVAPSVVHIGTVRVEDARPIDAEFRKKFGHLSPRESRGQGSGVVVDDEGYILTNYHVIYGARDIFVQLSDGRRFPAEAIGTDYPTDLALLRIKAAGLVPAQWADSDTLEVGSLVWAVGSPFGLDRSITSGILSAKDRRTIAHSAYQEFLQTDAAVNPGNSGGPLVDVEGRVVGINTAIIGDSFQGISFALAGNIAHRVYQQLRKEGQVRRGWLGVGLDEVDEQRARELGLQTAGGVYIPHVLTDEENPSPAARAGIEVGDVITRWNDHPVAGTVDFSNLVAQTSIGAQVDVVVFRGGEELTLQVIVGERPAR